MSDLNPPRVNHATAALDFALEALRFESVQLDTPRRIEETLMAAFASRTETASTLPPKAKSTHTLPHAQGFTRFFGQWFAPGAAIAVSVVMASWMMLSPFAQVGNQSGVDAAVAAYASDVAHPFIALQSLERIALEPSPRLIAANVPRTSLAAYGVPINPEMAGHSIRTEMLVAANGLPLAMRFLP